MLSRSFQREMKDILRLQTEVAVEIAQSVQGELGEDVIEEVERVAEVDPEAYRAFLQGQRELERRTPEGLQAAVDHFDRAVALDSGFSLPVAWRAGAHLMLARDRDSLPAEVLAQDLGGRAKGGGSWAEPKTRSRRRRVVLFDQLGAGLAGMAALVGETAAAGGEMPEVAEDSLRRRYLLESTRFGRRLGTESPLIGAHRLLQEGRYDSAAVVFTAIVEADPRT